MQEQQYRGALLLICRPVRDGLEFAVTARINMAKRSSTGRSCEICLMVASFVLLAPYESSAFTSIGPAIYNRRGSSLNIDGHSAKACGRIARTSKTLRLDMISDKLPLSAQDGNPSSDSFSKLQSQYNSKSTIMPTNVFTRAELLKASLLAGLIAVAQPLLVAAAALAANQDYDRWWVFPLAPFGHKKTSVAEVVPGQVRKPQTFTPIQDKKLLSVH